MVEKRRINVTFPVDLLEELDRFAPTRKRSQIIVEATAEHVRRLRLLSVIRATAGAWDDESHPELAAPEDIDDWLCQIRTSWRSEPVWQEDSRA